jgi:hypothetical protein
LAEAARESSVKCSGVIIPADPSIDSKIAINAPRDTNQRHTMRVFPPSCK